MKKLFLSILLALACLTLSAQGYYEKLVSVSKTSQYAGGVLKTINERAEEKVKNEEMTKEGLEGELELQAFSFLSLAEAFGEAKGERKKQIMDCMSKSRYTMSNDVNWPAAYGRYLSLGYDKQPLEE